MHFRQSPFRGEDADEVYDAILTDEPLYPINSPQSTVEVCQNLLKREPEQRLGSGPTDAQEVMNHSYFNGINWDDLYHKRVPTPYKPTISSEEDTSNFDTEITSITPVLTPVKSGKYCPCFGFYRCILKFQSLQSFRKQCKKSSVGFQAIFKRSRPPTSRRESKTLSGSGEIPQAP